MMTKVVKYFVELVRQMLIVPVAKSRLTCTFDRYPISSTLLFYSCISVLFLFKMSHQDSNSTHRSAEKEPVPSRADEVSNVRILYVSKLKCSYPSSPISIHA